MKNELCNCKEPYLTTHYTLCLNCMKHVSWETWITYWEKKVEEHKRNWR